MKRIPIGLSNFKELIESNFYYVDKTKMIEELVNGNFNVALFPRPRRFGKTLMLSMINNFFDVDKKEKNKDLFKGLYIENSSYYEERGTYPTIFLTFKDLKKGNYELFYEEYIEMMSDLYTSKKYVCDILEDWEKEYFNLICSRKANVSQYQRAIFNMTRYLERYHHKKTILLIDEYDVPIQDGYLTGYYDKVVPFIREIFSKALKDNDCVKFSVMTGVLRVSKESIFSDLNNVKVYGLMNSEFGEYFGFTRDNTKELLEYYDLELNEKVKEKYDGYNINGVEIYNPWSILNHASSGLLGKYWTNTSSNDLIKKVIMNTDEENRKVIEDLVQGKTYPFTYNEKLTYKDFDEYNDREIILNLLFSSGYLTIDSKIDDEVERANLKVPNKEVRELLLDILGETIFNKRVYLRNDVRDCIDKFDMAGFEKILNNVLANMSYHDSLEAFYHGSILGIFGVCLNKNYVVKSNRETGMGRCDILLENTDKSLGYIFEFKVVEKDSDMEKMALDALDQIEEKEYYKELLLDKVSDIHKVSVIFKNKECIVRSK